MKNQLCFSSISQCAGTKNFGTNEQKGDSRFKCAAYSFRVWCDVCKAEGYTIWVNLWSAGFG